MRIVHIEDFFHPDAGYQVNILSRYQTAHGHDVVVVCAELEKMPNDLSTFFGKEEIGAKDEAFRVSTGVRIVRIPLRAYVSGRAIYSGEIFRAVQALRPDLLYVHGNDTYIGIRYALRLKRLPYPVVFDNHMLAMASRNPFNNIFRAWYRTFVTPKILAAGVPVIRVVEDEYVQKHLGIPVESSPVIGFGTDILLFVADSSRKQAFRQRYNIPEGDLVAVYAGKLDVQKGGQFLADAIREKLETAEGRSVTFVIVGNAVGEYGREIEETFKSSKNRVLRFPTQKYRDLAEFYQAADIAVFPRQCSLSYFDVQAAELPVVAERNHINEERLSEGNGFTFAEGDIKDFRERIIECATMPPDALCDIGVSAAKKVAERYSYDKITAQYDRILEATVAGFAKKRKGK